MAISNRYILQQGPAILSLLKTAGRALKQRLAGSEFRIGQNPPSLPAPALHSVIKPRSPKMVAAYIRHLGADPARYRNQLPPHLFPQWALPLAMEVLAEIPYPLMRLVNGGCRLQVNAALPADAPLTVSAQLLDIDDNGRRAVMHAKIVTGTPVTPDALEAYFYWVVVLPKASRTGANATARAAVPRVPEHARELERWYLPVHSGLDFARLTGDFNPIHWLGPHARAFGFKNVILHGFDAQARVFEAVTRELASSGARIAALDVKFTRPLTLPAEVGVYLDGDNIFVGKAPGTAAYLTGIVEKSNISEAS